MLARWIVTAIAVGLVGIAGVPGVIGEVVLVALADLRAGLCRQGIVGGVQVEVELHGPRAGPENVVRRRDAARGHLGKTLPGQDLDDPIRPVEVQDRVTISAKETAQHRQQADGLPPTLVAVGR